MDRLSRLFDLTRERILGVLVVALMLLVFITGLAGLPGHASAQVPTRIPTIRPLGSTQVTAASTFATTSYAALPASSISFIPARDPNQLCAPGEPCPVPHLHITANLDVTKATATTGTCVIVANGAAITNTARTVTSAAGESTMALFADVTESVTYTGTPLTVSLECKSGDTDTFTVNNGQVYADEVY